MQARLTMKTAIGLLLTTCHGSTVTPVAKVIEMLGDMKTRGTNERQAEQVAFAQFKTWCENTSGSKSKAIASAADEIEGLNADIAKANSDITTLSNDIDALAANIVKWESDKKAATEERNAENDIFKGTYADLSESVDALERALIVMKKNTADKAQAASLLSKVVTLKRVPANARRVLAAFVQEPTHLSYEAPQANAYEFQSGGIVSMLEELLAKFTKERNTAQKEEMNAKHAYDMTFEDLVGSVRGATADKARKNKARSVAKKNLAVASGDLAKTSEMKAEDEKYLADTQAMCKQKSSEFSSRQELRQQELEAIDKAVEILSSNDVAGNAAKHDVTPTRRVFLQLKAASLSPNQSGALAYLLRAARRLGSENLTQLAERAAEDPFKKVKKMIWDMINKLENQANQEAEHKGWCDKEMKVNKQVRTQKTGEVDSLTSTKEQLTANIAKLASDIGDLTAEVNELDRSREEATRERVAEKKKNAVTVSDSKDAQLAVSNALKVLKDFYEKAGTATAFLEEPASDAPETWDEAYTGQQGSTGGVIGLLEVIQSDFARLEAETAAAEEESQREYEDLMADTKKDKAVKNAQINNKTAKKDEDTALLADTNADLKGTQEQLDAANRYHERLKPACVFQQVSHEDRMAKRQQEIDALKTSLKVLAGQQTE